ncbi:MAG: 23S rRNA (uracil(1939)-C(5))-methyltransferase RlmD [Nitrospirae bacterium]|nr:23S rRNA (uracil(1939)-C(5))-methyltransferase RlmD [Nitrospirota bacterium]
MSITPPLAVGQIISIPIEKLVDGGSGLGRLEGRVVFVPGVCPGEEVSARIRSVKKNHAEAELETVLKPSPDRIAPPCPVFEECGGCQWQHLADAAQLRAKVGILRENLARIGKLDAPDLLPPMPSPRGFEYRTRIQLKTDFTKDRSILGFNEEKSHRIVPIEACPIAHPILNRALAALRSLFSDQAGRPPGLTEIHLHLARATGEVLVRFFSEDKPPEPIEPFFKKFTDAMPETVGQVYSSSNGRRRVRGRDYLIDRFKDVPFRISDRSFAPVNSDLIEPLIDTVRTFARPTSLESVLELHCGIGTFGIFLARKASALTGFDENEVAIGDANHNAIQQGLTNCRFTAKPVARAVRDLVNEKKTFDCIVMDPPREGVHRKTLESLVRLNPSRIVYVSCDPATLARDLKILTDGGFRPGRLQPIDLFPQTYHLETVVELIKK